MPKSRPLLLFAGTSHPELVKQIVKEATSIRQGKVKIEAFPDGETAVRVLEDVQGQDVFILQTIAERPNHYLMEMVLLIDALKRGGASSVTGVMPYFGYGRGDRKAHEGDPISAKVVAKLLQAVGTTRVVTIDLHSPQIEGFFDIPLVHLSATSLLMEAIRKDGLEKSVMVAPDVGSIWRARELADALKTSSGFVDKHRINSKHVKSAALMGDVKNQNVVLVDDLCSTGQTLATAAEACKIEGAKKIFIAVTHGVFATPPLEGKIISGMIVTDTIPHQNKNKIKTVKTVSVASLLAKAMEKLYTQETWKTGE